MIFPKYSGVPIKFGDKGTTVQTLQEAMNVMFAKYPVYNTLVEDGIFGRETRRAVKEVQKLVQIDVTGIVEEQTWNTVFAVANIVTEP